MITLVVVFRKREGMTNEEFREYYREEHAPIVNALPNLQGYEVVFPDRPEETVFDGMALLRFDDSAALGEALDSEAAERMQADGANFVDQESLVQFAGQSEELLD